MTLENRLNKLENRTEQKTLVILSYCQEQETLEQAKERFKEDNGFELPDHAKIVCYQRIDIGKEKM